jgi:dienelactone hydrolase
MRAPALLRLVTGAGAVVLTLAGCSADRPPIDPTSRPDIDTRVLDLRDPARGTDPTPADPGADAVPGRALPTTLWYPADADGPLPVIVFSHGMGSTPEAYDELLSAWAAAGFVVAAPTFPLTSDGSARVVGDVLQQPADVSYVLTQVLALGVTPGDDLAGRIDPASVAVAGHSAGAATTVGLLTACCRDPRITAAVVLAGTPLGFGTEFADPGVPTFFVHGTADEVLPFDDDVALAAAAPEPTAFLELTGGTHSAPFDDGGDPLFPAVEAATTDFLEWALTNDGTALDALRAAPARWPAAVLSTDRLPH